jgi:DNA polymerase-1
MRKHPAKLEIVGAMILEQRRVQQLSTFVAESRVDADGRIRSSYGFSPETGRLSSTRAPNRRGANMQNQDREIRSMFVPDEGCVFLEVDYSQGESRIVAAYTGDRDLVRLARMAPGEFDEHREIAAVLFGCVACDVTADQRYIGKRVNHASNYGMHGKKLAEELSKDGYTFEDDECEVFIQKVLARKPAIVEWQRRVRMEVMRRRALTNAFGNTTRFPYERLCDDLYRRAYAYKPQSSLAKLLNLYGFVPCVRWIAKEGAEAAVAAHLHDALLVSVAPAWAYDLASFLVESMEVEIDYEGVALTIPVSVKVGNRWGEGVKFERMVERDEFERRCESVFASVDGGGAALEGGDGLRQAGDRAGMA